MESARSKVLALIPAFNEEKAIASVIIRTKKYAGKVIVCDDGSSDMTAEIASSLGVDMIRHEKNMGKGESLRDMFIEAARLEPSVVVTIDADGQHDPSEIPKLVAAIDGGADIAVGSREPTDIPRTRRVGNNALTRASMTGVSDTQSGFRAYNGRKIADLVPNEMGMGVDTEILVRAHDRGMKIVSVPISVSYQGETSTHNPVYHGFDVLLSTIKQLSIRHPLLFYGLPGVLCLSVAAGLWWVTLDHFVRYARLETNFAIAASAATLVGFLLLSVAIILWVLISVVRENRK
jgi:glycosyltransferase involved in cell wall biosynthesis